MAGRVVFVPFGGAATRALIDLVAGARDGDPLAPVTVVTPSATAGVTLRRRLAVDLGGLAAVHVQTLPQLVDRLGAAIAAADPRPALDPLVNRALLRRTVHDEPGPLQAVAASAATERAVEATLAELVDLDEAQLDALVAVGGPTTGAAVAVHRRHRTATAGFLTSADRVRRAIDAVVAGAIPADLGPVLVHVPRRVRGTEVALLEALGAAGELTVLLGLTGDADADAPARELAARLAPTFGPAQAIGETSQPPVPTTLVRAPDPDEEAAVAVRTVVEALAAGTARVDRIAIVARQPRPYVPVVRARLEAAGVPHHAPGVTTVAQSVPGRALLGLLALPERGFRRADLFAWARGAPLRDPASGRRVAASRWDRLAREAGVVAGLEQWQQRLARAAEVRVERRAYQAARTGEELPPLEDDHVLQRLDELGGFVADLAGALNPPEPASWPAWSVWLAGLLADYVDVARIVDTDGLDVVDGVVAGVASLDGVVAAPDLTGLRRVLERELDQPHRRAGRFGQGVAVGRLADVVGADLDLVVVLGAAEGSLPPRGRDDALVPDRDRAAAGGALPPRAWARAEEHRDLLAAIAAATTSLLITPRADPRAQRERQPAPWFLDACAARAEHAVSSGELASLRALSWFTDVESLEWWLGGGGLPATADELDLSILLADHRAGRPIAESIAATAHAELARGLAAACARRGGEFDGWTGNIGERPELVADLTRPRSPTGLEAYAECPFRYFLGHVLNVGAVDDPTEADVLSPAEQGSLVHEVLERFIRESGQRRPDQRWTDDDRARLDALAESVAGRYRSEGRTGRPLLWDVRWAQLRRQLQRILDLDEQLRAEHGVAPVAVEHRFGIEPEGVPPVVVELRGRRVAFRGSIDRVDRSPDGTRLLVLDYKTGKPDYYRAVEYDGTEGTDLTAKGTRLQLPIYALAAREAFPGSEQVEARYWFIGSGAKLQLKGGVFDDRAEARFHEVVGTIVDGVEAGRFPANPGDETWRWGRWNHDNCTYCDFDRVCPTSRGEQWLRIRRHPSLDDYVGLAEEHAGESE